MGTRLDTGIYYILRRRGLRFQNHLVFQTPLLIEMTEELKINRELVEMLSKRETDINEHLWTLYNLVQELGAKIVVELGAGQSTYVLLAATKETGGQFYSIDLDPSAHQLGFPEGRGILQKEPRYHFIAGSDMDIVKTWDKKIDFLFIDTTHAYSHTLCELKEWTPFVRVGGKIAMHDTFHKMGHAVGCRVALDEFLRNNPGRFAARHIESKGGLSILDKLKEI